MLVTNRGYDDPRVCMEARALAAGGHQVTVLGWDREVDADYRRQQDGVEFHCLQLRSTHGAGLKQVLFLGRFWWRMQAVLRAMRPAVIHCHDLDTVPGGYVAARRLKAKLVFDAHENFPDMMDGHLPCMAVRALRRLEAWFVPRCDLLISVGQRLVEYYRNLGARQVILVGNWKDRQAYEFTADQVAQSRQELGALRGAAAGGGGGRSAVFLHNWRWRGAGRFGAAICAAGAYDHLSGTGCAGAGAADYRGL